MSPRPGRSALGIAAFGLAATVISVVSAACTVLVDAGSYHVASGGGADASEEPETSGGPADAREEPETSSACPTPPEASACVPVTMMTLPPGGAACMGDGSTCYPHDTSGLAPTWTPPLGPHLGACTSQQIADFYAQCEDTSSTTTTCNAWKQVAANVACFGCLYTPSTASAYGAIVFYANNSLDEVNTFGCIAAVEPCNQPCGAAMLAQLECENSSCNSPYCSNFADYQACSAQADTCTACQQLVSASQNCQAELMSAATQHPSVDTCNLNALSFQDFFTSVATFLCGC
jgi:hypothetical protein